MPEAIDILENRLMKDMPELLTKLLVDHTTQQNIFWATDSYAHSGEGYGSQDAITVEKITGDHGNVIRPRAVKARDEQQRRSREMAEVFTPSWLCNEMNNEADADWFGRENVFNTVADNHQWQPVADKIAMPAGKTWQDYVQNTRLEITCGEAPFLVSRYDTVTGEAIPLSRRIGLLDRKLRVVTENADSESEWVRWALIALGSVYGYEWQGDSLLLAREAVVETFVEYYEQRFGQPINNQLLGEAAEIVSWNLWQMDGLKGVVPCSCREVQEVIPNFFGESEVKVTSCTGCVTGDITKHNGLYCQLRRWLPSNGPKPDHFEFSYLDIIKQKYKTYHKTKWLMKFDYIIGNPPYQQESVGANESDTPLYHYFFDSSFKLSDKVELISPARFLFKAGATPKEWDNKMLDDEHFKVLLYEPESSKIFSNTLINGGIAITYRDATKVFGQIGDFTSFEELSTIKDKVVKTKQESFTSIMCNRGLFKYSDKFYKECPKEAELTTDRRIAPSAFARMGRLFTENKPDDGNDYIQIYGNFGNNRVLKWFRRDYIANVENLSKYKVFISKADGAAGQIGKPIPARIIGKPIVMGPNIGCTETFITIGSVNTKEEAEAICKYIKTKLTRVLIGILKVTQNYAKPTWKYVPLQDFTTTSDIDWTKSVHEIDVQLYDKYGLTDEERNFIETYVKEM